MTTTSGPYVQVPLWLTTLKSSGHRDLMALRLKFQMSEFFLLNPSLAWFALALLTVCLDIAKASPS